MYYVNNTYKWQTYMLELQCIHVIGLQWCKYHIYTVCMFIHVCTVHTYVLLASEPAFGGLTRCDMQSSRTQPLLKNLCYWQQRVVALMTVSLKFDRWMTVNRIARWPEVAWTIIKNGYPPRRKNRKSKVFSTRTVRRTILTRGGHSPNRTP